MQAPIEAPIEAPMQAPMQAPMEETLREQMGWLEASLKDARCQEAAETVLLDRKGPVNKFV